MSYSFIIASRGIWLIETAIGRDPHHSLVLIHELGLFYSIFSPPVDKLPKLPVEHMATAVSTVNYLISNAPKSLALIFGHPDSQYLAWNIAAVIPWNGRVGEKGVSSAALAAREGLKMNNKDFGILGSTYKHVKAIQEAVQHNHEQEGGLVRERAGMLIRGAGATWTYSVLCGLLVDELDHWKVDEDGNPGKCAAEASSDSLCTEIHTEGEALEIIHKYDRFVERILELKVESAYLLAPIINVSILITLICESKLIGSFQGKVLHQLVGQPPGKWVKGALEQIVEWQLKYPEKGVDEANEFVRGVCGEWVSVKK